MFQKPALADDYYLVKTHFEMNFARLDK